MLVFLLLLLLLVTCSGSASITVTCLNATDYQLLLYQTCRRAVVCSHVYYLNYAPNAASVTADADNITKSREFRKFVYQIRRLIMLNDTGTNASSLLNSLLPADWAPPFRVLYNPSGSVSCSAATTTIQATAESSQQQLLTYSTLMAMQNFKMFVADEALCPEANQQLVMTGEAQVECVVERAKDVGTESTFATVLIVLLVFLLTAIVLWIPSSFLTLFATTARMRQIMTARSERQ